MGKCFCSKPKPKTILRICKIRFLMCYIGAFISSMNCQNKLATMIFYGLQSISHSFWRSLCSQDYWQVSTHQLWPEFLSVGTQYIFMLKHPNTVCTVFFSILHYSLHCNRVRPQMGIDGFHWDLWPCQWKYRSCLYRGHSHCLRLCLQQVGRLPRIKWIYFDLHLHRQATRKNTYHI